MVKQNEKVKKTSSKTTKNSPKEAVKKEVKKVEKEEIIDEFDDEEFADMKKSSNIEKTPLEKELSIIRSVSIASLVVSTIVLVLALLIFAKINGSGSKDLSRVTSSSSGSSDSGEDSSGEGTSTEYDVSMFNKISFDDFKNMFEDGDSKVRFVFTGRSNCSFCISFLPSLQKSVEEYDYELDYLDMITVYSTQASTYSKEDDKTLEEIRAMDSHFSDENTALGATPMVYVVQNGKVIDVHAGYTEYEDYASFLEEHNIKKK